MAKSREASFTLISLLTASFAATNRFEKRLSSAAIAFRARELGFASAEDCDARWRACLSSSQGNLCARSFSAASSRCTLESMEIAMRVEELASVHLREVCALAALQLPPRGARWRAGKSWTAHSSRWFPPLGLTQSGPRMVPCLPAAGRGSKDAGAACPSCNDVHAHSFADQPTLSRRGGGGK